jgi:putative tricarboxylic transport membrane protein
MLGERMANRGLSAELILGLVVLACAVVVMWQAGEIAASPLYAQVGPKFVPYVVGFGLAVLGAGLAVAALTGKWTTEPDEAGGVDRRALGWLAAGMIINCAAIGPLGFIIASTAMFACVARAFASKAWLRDLAIGFAIAVTAYVCFDKLLGININAGIFEGIL